MWFLVAALVFLRLLMWHIYPQVGISHFSDVVFGTCCLSTLVIYGLFKIRTVFSYPLMLFVAATAGTTYLNGCRDMDIKNLFTLDIYLTVVLAIQMIKHRRQIKGLLVCLLGYALLSAVFGIWQVFGLHLHRAPGLQGWPLSLAGQLLLFMPWAITHPSLRAAIICTGFAAAYSMLPAVSLVILYIRNLWMMLISLCFVAAAVLHKDLLGSFSTRIEYYQNALTYLEQSSLLGVGTSKYLYSAVSPSAFVHNSYLQIWIEQGFFGFVAIIWLVVVIFRHPLICQHRWVWLGLCAFLIDNLFSYTLLKANTSFLFWVMFAIYVQQHRKENPLSYDKGLSGFEAWDTGKLY